MNQYQFSRPLLGAHVSISGGVDKAPERGKTLTCDCIQIFSKNQNQWKAKPLSEETINRFKEALVEFDIKDTLIHDSYLINLGSVDEVKLEKSLEAFSDEIQRAEQLGVRYIVFHPGSHLGAGEDKGLENIARSLNYVIDKKSDSEVSLLLETTAGQGTNLGYRFEHLARIIDMVEDRARMGTCYDTQHTFAAGYDLRTKEGYDAVWREFDETVGLDTLKAFHLNDSRKELASRVDRHEHIGQGIIGETAFRRLMNDPRFFGIPMYLETPQGEEEYYANLKFLRSLFE